jgi:hypothetical protein
MKRALIVALTPISLVACGYSKEPTAVPKKFVASIEGFAGASYKVELAADGTVTYFRNPHTFTAWEGTKRSRIRIPAERWIEFRQQLDSAKVWSWNRNYSDPNIADGTVWHLEIVYADRKITSDGNNAYPNKEQFEALRAATQKLIGGKRFE